MKKLLIVALVFMMACGNKPITINTKTFNLKGDIKSISDTQVRSIYDDNWNTIPDTANDGLPSAVSTRYFDENGVWVRTVTELPEGTPYSETTVLFAENGDYSGSEDVGPDKKPLIKNTVTSITADKIEFESFDRYRKKLSSSTSEYENGLLVKQTTQWTQDDIHFETVFVRDEEGNETEMTYKNNVSGKDIEDVMKIKLLDFDEQGNWTRQILYRPGKDRKCVVIQRKIEYY